MAIKIAGSALNSRVSRVSGNTVFFLFFFWPDYIWQLYSIHVLLIYYVHDDTCQWTRSSCITPLNPEVYAEIIGQYSVLKKIF